MVKIGIAYHGIFPEDKKGLKLSGESFVHAGERGISMDEVTHIAEQTYRAAQLGTEIGIVIGGGNILRGAGCEPLQNNIRQLPAASLGAERYGIVQIPNALTYGEPAIGPSIQTQLILGELELKGW